MQVSRHVMRLIMLAMVIIFAIYGRSYAAQNTVHTHIHKTALIVDH